MHWRRLSLFIGVGLAMGLVSCGGGGGDGEELKSANRTVPMAAVELKGSTTVDKEAFPKEPLPEGGGYKLEEPDSTGTWNVETYQWSPGTITVVEGDRVTLEILGVNGSSHQSTIEGYDTDFEVKRGQLSKVDFTADKPGVFQIICRVHQPSMTGTLVVLPLS